MTNLPNPAGCFSIWFDRIGFDSFYLLLSARRSIRLQSKYKISSLILEGIAEVVEASEEAIRLRKAYLDAGIVGAKWNADALHVAVATVNTCRVIVSWNFRHIVHFQKIPLYNGINQSMGYAPIAIHSPEEVIASED